MIAHLFIKVLIVLTAVLVGYGLYQIFGMRQKSWEAAGLAAIAAMVIAVILVAFAL